ncbi:MAG: TonB-dependent receptor, partial [Bacteroidales bacterium]|nr:TonB-dependent receptor [Bacteroidales bacterium]
MKGSAYYFFRNEGLAGKTPTDSESAERKKLDPFTGNTMGLRIGAPIIKNKLFFFLSGELQRDQTPQPFTFNQADYRGNATEAQINSIQDYMVTNYGYDPGGYTANTRELNSDKILFRLDWNISDKHKLMARHSYTNNEALKPSRSNNGYIAFYNQGEYFPSVTNSSAIELKSNLSGYSNSLMVTFTSVRDDRGQMGDKFPSINIEDGTADIWLGSEQYSTGNKLDQDILTITENFTIYKGKHTITVGANLEYGKTYNLFMRRAWGEYRFSNIEDFLGDNISNRYRLGYSLVDDVPGDGTKAAAEFSVMQPGFYVQDEFQVTDQFKLTAGLRVDIPIFLDDPMAIDQFDTTLAKINAAGNETYGAKSGKMPKPQFMFAPRVGFNWDVTGDQTNQLRGGIGLFTGRLPLVWPGGAYTNNGLMQGSLTEYDTYRLSDYPEWDNQPAPAVKEGGGGQIDLFAENFKLPQVLRANLAFDRKLP